MHLTAAQDAKETWLVDDEVGCEAENSRKKRSLASIASLSHEPAALSDLFQPSLHSLAINQTRLSKLVAL